MMVHVSTYITLSRERWTPPMRMMRIRPGRRLLAVSGMKVLIGKRLEMRADVRPSINTFLHNTGNLLLPGLSLFILKWRTPVLSI